uniref:Methyltransferase domain-containing protein n=2 Tax=Panagrolaimus sp. JU765 TaxID=591449 RepID=A0AC34R184_9BILA
MRSPNGNIIVLICLIVGFGLIVINFGNYEGLSIKTFQRNVASKVHPETIQYYQSQIQARKNNLQNVPDSADFGILYNVLVPEVFCSDLVRVGTVVDGGKWICNPVQVRNLDKCTVYALGVNNDPSFEEDFQKFTHQKCFLRSFDKDMQNQNTLDRIKNVNDRIKNVNGVFKKALITSKPDHSKDMYTFKDLLQFFGDSKIDILKIDIEGFEFEIKEELVSVPMCQILIEVHGKTSRIALDFLIFLSKHGFYLFSYEINGFWHDLSEYSFIHESCLNDYDVNVVYGRYLS